MRIFLSYGHDEHTSFAQRLKSDLEGRCHEVWFDADRLKPGGEWERYIEDGLDWVSAEHGIFVVLLTPHAVRRPAGYCLNELARACSRHLPVIPLMVCTVEPPLSICRIQWLDFRDCVPAEKHEERYAARFEKLLDAIEHNGLDVEGTQARLRSYLRPIEYDEPSRHLPRFTGRTWIMPEVDRWLASGRRVLWITGEAGIGKSALAVWLCDRRPEIAGAHYCRFNNANRSAPRALLSLAWQLTTQLPDYHSRINASQLDVISAATNITGLFEGLFVEPLNDHFPIPERKVVLLIDALDEATEQGTNELALVIGSEWDRTPGWLRLIVTSRPHEPQINSALQALDPWVLEAGRVENRQDIRTYLGRELRPYASGREPEEEIIEAIQQKSEGLFLYVWWLREELEAGRLSLADADTFPRGLGGIFHEMFRRYFPDTVNYSDRWRPMIETICAARQPLSLDDLNSMFPAFYHPNEIASGLGSLFPSSGGEVRPFHQSLRDWITQAGRVGPYVARVDRGHERLADEGWRQYTSDPQIRLSERMSFYFVRHLPVHLSVAHRQSDLAMLLLDAEWIQAKVNSSDVSALLTDFEYLPRDETCALVLDSIQRSAHAISTNPEELASQLMGRLLPHTTNARIRDFSDTLRRIAPVPWLRPLKPALSSPGTPLQRTLEGHHDAVSTVAVTPDGRRAISGSRDNTVRVWSLDTGRALRILEGHSAPVRSVAVTPDGRRVVSASEDHTLKVWGLDTGCVLRTLEGHSDKVYGVALTPDGRRAVSASRDHTLKMWDLDTGRALRTFEGHSASVFGVAVLPDGKRAVSASWDQTLKMWNLDSGCTLQTLEGHSAVVRGVALTPDGRWAVSASSDSTLKVWDLNTGRLLRTLKGHNYDVFGVAVTPDGRRVISAGGYILNVWDLDTGSILGTLEGHYGAVSGVAVTPDGKRAVSAGVGSTLKVWDLDTRRACKLEGHTDSVSCVAVSPNGKTAVSASRDKTLKVWDLDTGRALRTLEGHSDSVSGVAVTPDGKLAVSAGEDGTLKVWDLNARWTSGRTLKGRSDRVYGVALTPDGKTAISASRDKTLRLWHLDSKLKNFGTNAALGTLKGHSAAVLCVTMTPNGRWLVSASEDKTLKVWDLDTACDLRTLEGHSAAVRSVAVTPDGKLAVSASQDLTLKVWDLNTGHVLCTLEGHSGSVSGVAVAPNGKRAASASEDKTLKVWDLDTGLLIATFHCDGHARCCAFIDQHRIIAGDGDGRLYILSIEESDARAAATEGGS